MKYFFFFIFSFILSVCCIGQRSLTRISDLAYNLNNRHNIDPNNITQVIVLKESGLGLNIQCEYTGFRDRKYSIKAEVLNSAKIVVREVPVVIKDLNERDQKFTIDFYSKKLSKSNRANFAIATDYVRLTLMELNDGLGDVAEEPGKKVFLFDCKKVWRHEPLIKTSATNK